MEMLKEIEWSDYAEILNYGTPPVYVQLLILIGFALSLYVYRTVRRVRPMSKGNKTKYKVLFVVAFFLILFQQKFEFRGITETLGF